jgi:hypothetical protein
LKNFLKGKFWLSRYNSDNSKAQVFDEAWPLSGRALKELLESVFEKKLPFRFKAGGLSMSPFIRDGDILTLLPLGGAAPKLGQVVIFLHPSSRKPVVHRVVAKRESAYLIGGDNSLAKSHWLSIEDILGRLDSLERNGRRVFFGLGPERLLIVFLTRSRVLQRIILPLLQAFQFRSTKRSL